MCVCVGGRIPFSKSFLLNLVDWGLASEGVVGSPESRFCQFFNLCCYVHSDLREGNAAKSQEDVSNLLKREKACKCKRL